MICEGENLTSLEIQGHVDAVHQDTSLGKYKEIYCMEIGHSNQRNAGY